VNKWSASTVTGYKSTRTNTLRADCLAWRTPNYQTDDGQVSEHCWRLNKALLWRHFQYWYRYRVSIGLWYRVSGIVAINGIVLTLPACLHGHCKKGVTGPGSSVEQTPPTIAWPCKTCCIYGRHKQIKRMKRMENSRMHVIAPVNCLHCCQFSCSIDVN